MFFFLSTNIVDMQYAKLIIDSKYGDLLIMKIEDLLKNRSKRK